MPPCAGRWPARQIAKWLEGGNATYVTIRRDAGTAAVIAVSNLLPRLLLLLLLLQEPLTKYTAHIALSIRTANSVVCVECVPPLVLFSVNIKT